MEFLKIEVTNEEQRCLMKRASSIEPRVKRNKSSSFTIEQDQLPTKQDYPVEMSLIQLHLFVFFATEKIIKVTSA